MLLKLTAMILSQVTSALSRKGSSLSQPALFTTMSSWPSCARASSTARLTSGRRVRSQLSASPFTPSASISRLTASALSARMSSTATSAPSWASANAMARPMPRPPPVTSAVLPLSFIDASSFELLVVDPHGLALLGEGAQALPRVVRHHELVPVQSLEVAQHEVERHGDRLAHGTLGQPEHGGAVRGEPCERRLHGLGEPVGRHHAVHEPDAERLARVQHVAREQELERTVRPDADRVVQRGDGR